MGLAFVALNILAVFGLPLYSGTSGNLPFHANLLHTLDPKVGLFHLLTPLALALTTVAPLGRTVNRSGLVAFWTYGILGSASIGLLYLPSAALLTWMSRVPAPLTSSPQ